jgi:nicotinate-nucleotide adenylyltransferase
LSNFEERDIIEKLKVRLLEKRFNHSINVMKMAVVLAKKNGVDETKAKFAGLLHDCAKNMSDEELISYCLENNILIDEIKKKFPGMLHAEVGADIAKREFEADEEICEAIRYHTLGNIHMTTLDKIIYVADLIEEGRELEGIEEIREAALKDINEGYLMSLAYCINNVKERGKELHPQSVEAFNAAKNYQ